MSTGIINKLEYRIAGTTTWNEMDCTGYSANYTSTMSDTAAGKLYNFTVRTKMAGVNIQNGNLLDSLAGRKLELRLTDADGFIHYVGDTYAPARLVYDAANDGTPGSWNGYTITFTHGSPVKHTIL
jgi:hypothetical protein